MGTEPNNDGHRHVEELHTCPHCGKNFYHREEILACQSNNPSLIAPPQARVRLSLRRVIGLHGRSATVMEVRGPVKDTRYPNGEAKIWTFQISVRLDNGEVISSVFSDQVEFPNQAEIEPLPDGNAFSGESAAVEEISDDGLEGRFEDDDAIEFEA